MDHRVNFKKPMTHPIWYATVEGCMIQFHHEKYIGMDLVSFCQLR